MMILIWSKGLDVVAEANTRKPEERHRVTNLDGNTGT